MTVKTYVEVNQPQLKELKRAVKNVGPDAVKQTKARMKPAGEIIRKGIVDVTPTRGSDDMSRKQRSALTRRHVSSTGTKRLHPPGLLKRSTKLRAGNLSVSVLNDARTYSKRSPQGYRYGKRLEFDPKFGYVRGKPGTSRHSWFYKGYNASSGEALKEFDKVLNEVAKEYGR